MWGDDGKSGRHWIELPSATRFRNVLWALLRRLPRIPTLANEFNETRRESCNLSWCALVHDLPKGISDNPVIVPAGRHSTESALQVKTPQPPGRSLLTSPGILSASRSSALSFLGTPPRILGAGPGI